MSSSGLQGGIYTFFEWIMKFVTINLLWIVFNIPIVYLFFNIHFVGKFEDLFILLLMLLIILPFIFFPATQAMFASVRDWLLKKGDKSLIKSYWLYYKENYIKSLLGGIILSIIWFVWLADFYFSLQQNELLMGIFSVTGVVLYVYTINFFSVGAHLDIKLRSILKKALLVTFASPGLFFYVLLSNILLLFIGFNFLTFLIPFFMGSLISFVSIAGFYKVFLKINSD